MSEQPWIPKPDELEALRSDLDVALGPLGKTIEMTCEHGCCWIVAYGVGAAPGIGHRTCNYCDAPREPRDCGEPCRECSGRPKE